METTLIFNEKKKRFNIFYREEHSYLSELSLKFDKLFMDMIYANNINLTLDLVFKFPGKEKVFKRVILSKDNLNTNYWSEIVYCGEFLREVTVFSDKYFPSAAEIQISIHENRSELPKTTFNDEQLLKLILVDNWFSFIEEMRKLQPEDFKVFINEHLNGIQELNANELSSHLIEYTIVKQIIELFGVSKIDGAYLDIAAEVYLNGYDLIKNNNQLVIENYNMPDWMTLNIRMKERSDQVIKEYGKLKEKINKHIKNDKAWEKVLERLNDFTIDAEQLYRDYVNVIDELHTSNKIKNLEFTYQDWLLLQDNDARQEAKIIIQSTLPFGPAGFKMELVFLLETNPSTYQQEFTLTLSDCNTEILTSERLRHTKIIHSARSLEDLRAINEDRTVGIEKEFYAMLMDCISGSNIYRNFDFQTIKPD